MVEVDLYAEVVGEVQGRTLGKGNKVEPCAGERYIRDCQRFECG